jgi:thiol-disulfide isomerase/thioredoxin
MNLANQFSFVLFSLAGLLALGLLLRWRGASWRVLAPTLAAAAVIAAAAFFVLRPGFSDVDSAQAANQIIRSGRTTLVEFFSNYCIGCMAVRPTVDALVSEIRAQYGDEVNILRIDIHTDFGRELRSQFGFSYTPEFILFNATGQEIWRSHIPPSLPDIEHAANLSSLSNTSG